MNHLKDSPITRAKSIIHAVPEKNQYLHERNTRINDFSSHKGNICIPLVADTEFARHRRKGATVQLKAFGTEYKRIYDHQDLVNHAASNGLTSKLRHKPITHDFAALNYLEDCGYGVELKTYDLIHRTDLQGNILSYCQFDIYSHFALAELLMIFTGSARNGLIEIILHDIYRKVEMTRRLRTLTLSKKGCQVSDSIELPMHIILNEKRYRIKLRIIDTCALHGVASYENLAAATGVKLQYKNILTKEDLKDMYSTYFNKPKDYDLYSLGDLEVDKILINNAKLFKKVYESLGCASGYQLPKLTIGSTVNDLFLAKVCQRLDIKPYDKEQFEKLIKLLSYGSTSTLKTQTSSTACLLAKVYGGRCRNNRPTDIGVEDPLTNFRMRPEIHNQFIDGVKDGKTLGKVIEKLIIDNDIAGAYGNGLRNQIYPIGRPIIEEFGHSKHNQYMSLRKWLKQRKYGKSDCDLVDGLWIAIVSTFEINRDKNQWATVKYAQDFLPSWTDFKFTEVANMESDTDLVGHEINSKTGNIKILNNQIIQAPITNNFLEWLFNICSPRQRNELLDNLYVNTACYYRKDLEVKSYKELVKIYETWSGKNTTKAKNTKIKNRNKTISTTEIHKKIQECHYWIGLDLGELIVDDLLAWRAMHKKLDGKKSPMDVLFKLCTNTLYGVFCSPYFDISNTVVGNNITARCRAMAWYMEKGHYAYQSITDGGQIDLLKLCFPISEKRKITTASVTNLYRLEDPTKNHIKLKPIEGYDHIEIDYTDQQTKIDKLIAKGKKEKDIAFIQTINLRLIKDDEALVIHNPKEWLENKLFEHLQKIFPNVSVLHKETSKLVPGISNNKTPTKSYQQQKGMFAFEIKDLYTKARFHGTSNYLLSNERLAEAKIAMRSYEKKNQHIAFTINENDDYVETKFYEMLAPSQFLMEQLDHPTRVIKSKTFKKTGILKLNDWKRNYQKWLDKGYVCGDTIEKVGLLREFSISQFTYQTIEQFNAIKKEVERNKRKYNQSYEGYFTNDDGTLNYQEMVQEIDRIIAKGAMSINDVLDENRNRLRDLNMEHCEAKVYQAIKLQVNEGIPVQDDYYDNWEDSLNVPREFDGDLSDIDFDNCE